MPDFTKFAKQNLYAMTDGNTTSLVRTRETADSPFGVSSMPSDDGTTTACFSGSKPHYPCADRCVELPKACRLPRAKARAYPGLSSSGGSKQRHQRSNQMYHSSSVHCYHPAHSLLHQISTGSRPNGCLIPAKCPCLQTPLLESEAQPTAT